MERSAEIRVVRGVLYVTLRPSDIKVNCSDHASSTVGRSVRSYNFKNGLFLHIYPLNLFIFHLVLLCFLYSCGSSLCNKNKKETPTLNVAVGAKPSQLLLLRTAVRKEEPTAQFETVHLNLGRQFAGGRAVAAIIA